MCNSYECTLNGQIVGTVELVKTGLYYRIKCRCKLLEEGFYRLHVATSAGQEKIGVCIPNNGILCCDAKIPVSRLGTDRTVKFYLQENHIKEEFHFYPLDNCNVTDFFPNLPRTFFISKDGQRGIGVKQINQETQDSGLNP